ncbi:MAG: helix-turn-helix domain-containing protein [Chloroflexi bacterium]|nr:helix-turn-helix domain-containing protein [Chloroflexota bacterium]
MIANERQYRITKAAMERFEEALAKSQEPRTERDPRLQQAMREGIESQLEELREQLAEYEALRAGRVAVLELHSLKELPEALIRARIASGLSQKQLAERLGMKEQQLQRWEATRYAGISLDRIHEVAEALGVKIREEVILPRGQ